MNRDMAQRRFPPIDVVWLVLVVSFITGWAAVYAGAEGIGGVVVYIATAGLVALGLFALGRFLVRTIR